MNVNIDGVNVKSNSTQGDAFLIGMVNSAERTKGKESELSEFCRNNDIETWHIIDGWLWPVGDSFCNRRMSCVGALGINLVWIYSHNTRKPMIKKDKRILIIDLSVFYYERDYPCGIYDVIECKYEDNYTLRLVDMKNIKHTKQHGFFFYIPEKVETLWDKFVTLCLGE